MLVNENSNSPRFSLYHLDEGEMYIKEFAGNCQFIYPTSNQIELLKGVIHFCSRSIVFEPDSHDYLIVKFHFRNFLERPKIQNITNTEMFKLKVNKMTLIPTPPIFDAYRNSDITTDVIINFFYEKIEVVAQIIFELIDKFNAKQSSFEFDSIEYLGTLYSFQFDYTLVKTINEKFLLKSELSVKQLLPLINIPGTLMLTDQRIYFQPVFKINLKKCISIKFSKITQFYKRKISQGEIGLEIVAESHNYPSGKTLFIIFDTESNREMIYDLITAQTNIEAKTNFSIEKYSKLWIEGAISNYDYLILLNSAGNRTRNDLSQYPIFPWIISNYSSPILDLTKEENFRDLSKPIGALNQKRLKQLKERYNEMSEPKFLYGSHYSTPAYVIGYLMRKYPHYMLKLHSGKFDHPDRLFSSIEIDWQICNSLSVKELIPEFYENDIEFLVNEKKICFGLTSDGEKIDKVKLPAWAINHTDFLRKMREALESDYVNQNLHKWIDLIFGYKQRGKAAIENDNCKNNSF
ncbi:MAG: hypothetical protein MJ252_16955 [archaeon]|nr:hypothetical protein [archaeon]